MIDSEEDTDIPRDDEPDANVKTDGKSEGVENEDIRNEGVKHEGVKKGDSSSGQAVRSAVVDAADPVLIVEAVLFSAGRPLTAGEIAAASGCPVPVVREALNHLIRLYGKKKTALEVGRSEDKYLLRVKDEIAPFTTRLARLEVPLPYLKTLAVVAYEQPVPQRWVIDKIGEKAATHIRELSRMGFIQRERKGRGYILTTTKKFAAYFGLESGDPDTIRRYLASKVGLPYKPQTPTLESVVNSRDDHPKEDVIKNEVNK